MATRRVSSQRRSSGATVTLVEIVLDASVAVRGLDGEDGPARELVDEIATGATVAHAPDLIVSEVTNALRVRVDAARWPVEAAQLALETLLSWPIVIQPCGPLATSALDTATARGISAYDAFYAVLAEALGLPLVTADRRLADAVPGAMLVA